MKGHCEIGWKTTMRRFGLHNESCALSTLLIVKTRRSLVGAYVSLLDRRLCAIFQLNKQWNLIIFPPPSSPSSSLVDFRVKTKELHSQLEKPSEMKLKTWKRNQSSPSAAAAAVCHSPILFRGSKTPLAPAFQSLICLLSCFFFSFNVNRPCYRVRNEIYTCWMCIFLWSRKKIKTATQNREATFTFKVSNYKQPSSSVRGMGLAQEWELRVCSRRCCRSLSGLLLGFPFSMGFLWLGLCVALKDVITTQSESDVMLYVAIVACHWSLRMISYCKFSDFSIFSGEISFLSAAAAANYEWSGRRM